MDLWVLIRMAKVIVTLKIMPESPDIDLSKVEETALGLIKGKYGDVESKTEVQNVAFGLKALNLIIVIDESQGTTDEVEAKISEVEGVNSVEVTDVRRALG